jgi:putative transposase
MRLRPCWRGHVWAYNFVQARAHDNKVFRMVTVIDEFTRECLAIEVARRLRYGDALACLTELFVQHGPPGHICTDNGSEFTATAVRELPPKVGVQTLYIEPGSPWENGYNERFNGTLRREVLNSEWFTSIKQAQVVIETWLKKYNHIRPHQALNMRPPVPETLSGSGT